MAPILEEKTNGVPVLADISFEPQEKHDLVLKVFRAFIADQCQQYNGGHPGYDTTNLCPGQCSKR